MNPLITSLYATNCLLPDSQIAEWIEQQNRSITVSVRQVSFRDLEKWRQDLQTGNLVHESGRFFSIEGIRVKTDYENRNQWEQPIINQPEVGILGIIAREIDGVLYFLMQAKIEPGNVNCVQISPTLQATKSNYRMAHQGKQPLYLEYFLNAKPENIILDQLQSEQGARFLRKRNRNIIIKTDEQIPVYENFVYMTIGQIKQMMLRNNVVNMDTRTVLSGILWDEIFKENFIDNNAVFQYLNQNNISVLGKDLLLSALNDNTAATNSAISWLSRLKSGYDLSVERIPLNQVREWQIKDDEIVRADRRYFRVLGVDISISNREVARWCQPIIQPMQDGFCAFIIKKINGVYHFLVQAKLECGNFDIFELAPTVQCLTGGYTGKSKMPQFLDYILQCPKSQIVLDTLQSEEGGRFYREQNRNMLVIADDGFSENVPDNFKWLTLGQLYKFLKFNNYLNIQARSLLSMISFK